MFSCTLLPCSQLSCAQTKCSSPGHPAKSLARTHLKPQATNLTQLSSTRFWHSILAPGNAATTTPINLMNTVQVERSIWVQGSDLSDLRIRIGHGFGPLCRNWLDVEGRLNRAGLGEPRQNGNVSPTPLGTLQNPDTGPFTDLGIWEVRLRQQGE